MPMLECPHCGVRQYAAASYVEQPRCVICESALGRTKSAFPKAWRSASPSYFRVSVCHSSSACPRAEACEDVRTAYKRWQDSKDPRRALEFERYTAALDHEEYAANIYSFRTARLRSTALEA